MLNSRNVATGLAVVVGVSLAGCGGEHRQIIQEKGSDTMVNVAQAWAEAYQTVEPAVTVAVSGGGSGTGIAALINGTADIANSSRELHPDEVVQATKNGHAPVSLIVGYDALAVYLHPDNPIDTLSKEQLATIYGNGGSATHWTDLGVEVPGCKDQEIVLISRQNNSGTYEYFREAILGKRDFRLGTLDMHGSREVVDLVENTPCAIGYSGLAYATDRVKMACLAAETGGSCINPTEETAKDGTYPIARPLLMYTSGRPWGGAVDRYLDWIMSDAGQCIIMQQGYAPATNVGCDSSS
ncbi:MAG: phosphate ABC transporter substrate-binding protein [Xanthomonadales bacterium]|nr:phosphate ABC transporter substrate-binding protein [Xanthomonadales bacterium]